MSMNPCRREVDATNDPYYAEAIRLVAGLASSVQNVAMLATEILGEPLMAKVCNRNRNLAISIDAHWSNTLAPTGLAMPYARFGHTGDFCADVDGVTVWFQRRGIPLDGSSRTARTDVARAIAKLHMSATTAIGSRAGTMFGDQRLVALAQSILSRPQVVNPMLRAAASIVLSEAPMFRMLPHALCHGDVRIENAVWNPSDSVPHGGVSLIDFEFARWSFCLYDLTQLFYATVGDSLSFEWIGWTQVRRTVEHYDEIRALNDDERAMLGTANLCSSFVIAADLSIREFPAPIVESAVDRLGHAMDVRSSWKV